MQEITVLASAYYNRGFVYEAQGKFDEAIANYTEAIRLNPDDASAYNNRGSAYEAQRKFNEAISSYAEAIRLKPNHALYHTNLKKIFLRDDLDGLENLKKDDIFSAIKLLPEKEQIVLLEKCINPTDVLGDRFWKPEGFYNCLLHRGTLKEICDHLKRLDPTWGEPTPILNGHTLFNKYPVPAGDRSGYCNPVYNEEFYPLK